MMITQRFVSGVKLIEVPLHRAEQSFSSAVAEGLSNAQKGSGGVVGQDG